MLEEKIERLKQYGYLPAEAHFLALAAVHSGYFVRRQFNQFLGQERGGNAQRLIEKLIARRHAQAERYLSNLTVYHIRGKGIYSRLGQTDNRNRRERAPFTVKRKLMCLDFVLAHRERRFLETEAEKVEYFVVERGVEAEALPGRRYQSRKTTEVTERFFVDKLPILIDPLAAPSVVHFAYVDEGAQSTEGFSTFLCQHRRLFEAVRVLEVVYVAAEPRWFPRAESTFHRLIGMTPLESPVPPERLELLEYFETRRRFETRDFTGLETAQIVRYRAQKGIFSDDKHEEMYRRWREAGVAALFPEVRTPRGIGFRTYLLPHDYGMFGVYRHAS